MISSSSLQQQLLDESVWRGGIRRHTALQPLDPEHHMLRRMQTCCSSMTQGAVLLQAQADFLVEQAVDVNSTHGISDYNHKLCRKVGRGGGEGGVRRCLV